MLADHIPSGLRVEISTSLNTFPDEPGAIFGTLSGTDDPAWPCLFDCFICRSECGLGPYPDLHVASLAWERFGLDALCSTYPFVGNLDPADPYWSLALVGGRWFLASTCGTRLMSDEDRGSIRLIRPVVVPAPRA